jgi:hypothetical protein
MICYYCRFSCASIVAICHVSWVSVVAICHVSWVSVVLINHICLSIGFIVAAVWWVVYDVWIVSSLPRS